jgi:ATP-dependent exoDNAse (exonuclease V) alpha subunit
MYSQRGRLIAGDRCEDVMRRLVADWHAAGNPATGVMIAHRRRDVAELNGRARMLMRADGRLGDQQLYLPGGTFSTGDQVVVKLNDTRLGVRNSDRGVIVDVDLAARTLAVRLSNATVRLPRSFLERTTSRGGPTLVHGYAITAYASQGMTCERAYVFARDDAYREWAYTTMTRARSASRLYVVAERATERDEFAPTEPARDARAAVAAARSRSDERRFASEHIERGPDRTLGIDR